MSRKESQRRAALGDLQPRAAGLRAFKAYPLRTAIPAAILTANTVKSVGL